MLKYKSLYVLFYAYALLFVSLCKLLDTNKLLKYNYTIGTFKVYICIWERLKQAGTELCQAQLKLASSLFCFRLKDNLGSLLNDLKNVT